MQIQGFESPVVGHALVMPLVSATDYLISASSLLHGGMKANTNTFSVLQVKPPGLNLGKRSEFARLCHEGNPLIKFIFLIRTPGLRSVRVPPSFEWTQAGKQTLDGCENALQISGVPPNRRNRRSSNRRVGGRDRHAMIVSQYLSTIHIAYTNETDRSSVGVQ